MSSKLPTPIDDRRALGYTPIGVDVNEKNLAVAAPANSSPESAFVVKGKHVREQYQFLVEGIRALEAARFDATRGQVQLFAAMWDRLRTQLFDAAVRVVRYARRHSKPLLVLEDLQNDGFTLWERRSESKMGAWLLPALQQAISMKAHEKRLPVAYVDPQYTTQECHHCGELTRIMSDVILCSTADCPVNEVCRDRSAALTIAQRAL